MLFEISCLVGLLVVVIILYKIFITLNHIRIDLLDQTAHQAEIKYWKNKAGAGTDTELDALLTIIYSDLLHPRKKEEHRLKIYEQLKTVYGERFSSLGHDFPEYPFKQDAVEAKKFNGFLRIIKGGRKAS